MIMPRLMTGNARNVSSQNYLQDTKSGTSAFWTAPGFMVRLDGGSVPASTRQSNVSKPAFTIGDALKEILLTVVSSLTDELEFPLKQQRPLIKTFADALSSIPMWILILVVCVQQSKFFVHLASLVGVERTRMAHPPRMEVVLNRLICIQFDAVVQISRVSNI